MADEPKAAKLTLDVWRPEDSYCDDALVQADVQFIYPINRYCASETGGTSDMFTRGYEELREAYGSRFKVPRYAESERPLEETDRVCLFDSRKASLLSRNPNFYIFRHSVQLVPQPVVEESDFGIKRYYSDYRMTAPILEYAVRGESEKDEIADFMNRDPLGSRAIWLALTEKYSLDGLQEYAPTTPAWDYLDRD